MARPVPGAGLSVLTMAIGILPKYACVADSPAVAQRFLMYQSRAWAGSLTRMWTLSMARFGAAGSAATIDAAASRNEAHIVATVFIGFSFSGVFSRGLVAGQTACVSCGAIILETAPGRRF